MDRTAPSPAPIDLTSLERATATLQDAIHYWQTEPHASGRKPHLRAGVVQTFEFTYELSMRLLRRVLMERALSTTKHRLSWPTHSNSCNACKMQSMEADVALTPEQKALVSEIIRQKLPAAQVQVFGSRATGKARPYSDLDLLFIQPARLAWEVRYELEDAFESSTLPFRVDLVDVETVSPQILKRIRSEATVLPL